MAPSTQTNISYVRGCVCSYRIYTEQLDDDYVMFVSCSLQKLRKKPNKIYYVYYCILP